MQIPNEIDFDKLKGFGFDTASVVKEIAESKILGEDLSAFMDGFLKNLLGSNNQKQEKEFTQEQEEMFAKVKEFSSQKKTKNKEYEISNHKSIKMAR